MNMSISQIELIVSAEDNREVWAVVPALPVQDWPTIRTKLPTEYAEYELRGYVPMLAISSEGWVLRRPSRPALVGARGPITG